MTKKLTFIAALFVACAALLPAIASADKQETIVEEIVRENFKRRDGKRSRAKFSMVHEGILKLAGDAESYWEARHTIDFNREDHLLDANVSVAHSIKHKDGTRVKIREVIARYFPETPAPPSEVRANAPVGSRITLADGKRVRVTHRDRRVGRGNAILSATIASVEERNAAEITRRVSVTLKRAPRARRFSGPVRARR